MTQATNGTITAAHVMALKLLRLLTQQKQCYAELQRLAQQQRDLILAQQPEALLSLLSKRQQMVEQITQLQVEFSPYLKQWDAIRETLAAESRQQIQSLLDELKTMLDGILEQDREDANELSQRKDAIGKEMASANRGRVAAGAYAGVRNTPYATQRSGGKFEVNG